MPDRVLENGPWIEGLIGARIDPLGEDQIAENRLWVWRSCAYEFLLDGEGDMRGGGHRWGISY